MTSLNLDHYRNRVHAAVSTNQCLDYAQDVSDLIRQLERYEAGVQAAWEFYENCYTKAVRGPFIGYSDIRSADTAHQIASQMWDAMNDAMGERHTGG